MTNENYKQALVDAMKENHDLIKQIAELDRRRARLIETITTLMRLVGGENGLDMDSFLEENQELAAYLEMGDYAEELGLSESVRQVLLANGGWMSATQVKDGLIRLGINMMDYRNPLAVIHTTLKRLVEGGDVLRDIFEPETKAKFRWNTSEFKHSPLKWVNQRKASQASKRGSSIIGKKKKK
jgi:hypothetical protein